MLGPEGSRYCGAVAPSDPHLVTLGMKPRARALGVPFGGRPGAVNAITDVPGVEIGHTTLIRGDDVRTGVTAIHPRGREEPGTPCAAGVHVLNGNGEMTGVAWVEESGTLAWPVTLTNTNAVGVARDATITWVAERFPVLGKLWMLPVAAETWDGYLNAIGGGHVTAEVVHEALSAARPGPVDEGSVGGGTGMSCYEWKGGCGTASRLVAYGGDTLTVGAHLQCNFGDRSELTIAGVPVGRELAAGDPRGNGAAGPPAPGSVIAVVATDAPLLPGQCAALARRVPLGLARTGTAGGHFSGDLFLAFSTANRGAWATGLPEPAAAGHYDELRFLPWKWMDALFTAVVECVEEAVIDSLVANESMTGRDGHHVPALPLERVVELLRRGGAAG